jgi:hypothetical protein
MHRQTRFSLWLFVSMVVLAIHFYIGVRFQVLETKPILVQNVVPLELIETQTGSVNNVSSPNQTEPLPKKIAVASSKAVKRASVADISGQSDMSTEKTGSNHSDEAVWVDTEQDKKSDEVSTDAAPHASAVSIGKTFSPPPSARMVYSTSINGVPNQSGAINWTYDGQRYQLEVKIPLPFIGPFVYSSEGGIDQHGLAPDRYTEQRGFKRAVLATNFNRDDRSSISFSRLTTTLPLVNGAQDRFSVLMQVVGLVRGQPERYVQGTAHDFYIADTDSGETWRLAVHGLESIETAIGHMEALHIVRLPRYPDDKRQLEMWLAPSLGWYVAQLRQTEPNGLVAELKIEKIEPITPN